MSERGHFPTAPEDSGGRSILDFLALVVDNRRLLFGLPILTAASALVFSLAMPKRYTVESRFIPESGNAQGSRIAGLAAQFGVDIGNEGGESVDFYAELLESHDLLRSVVLTDYAFEDGGDQVSGNLVELLKAGGEDEDERIRSAVERVEGLVVVRPDPGAKIVTVRTSAPWPELAVQTNARLLELLSEFNMERRQTRAASERQFLQARVQEAESDLRAAETALERFMSENRRWTESPQLTFEQARLQRRVNHLEQLYGSLAQGYEQARVDEVRNTPVITVIDQPRPPARQTAPRYGVNALLGALLGFLLGLSAVVAREVAAAARRKDPVRYARLKRGLLGGFAGRGATANEPERNATSIDESPRAEAVRGGGA